MDKLVRELMKGDKGKIIMKNNVMEWKRQVREATNPDGSSYLNLDKLVNEILLSKKKSTPRMIFGIDRKEECFHFIKFLNLL